ncbi:MAG TPA: dihydrodipicolinate reductase C-terminal domain-containing protein [Pyrinomonadaceae bacterium]|jgi:4-hydroxy-tetrahydrodipicolinate reductase|nr:dihydrodipicolinate reductase C-terminal domain-containing protein [Pyrinomonadaceae bacterium]
MKLALIGNGAMGRLVAALAADGGDEVGAVVSSRESSLGAEELAEVLRGHDAVVDFTVAEAVRRNAEACALAGVPLVEGTTGWSAHLGEVRASFEKHGGALVYGANFSVGVQIFYRVVERAAELFRAAGYAPFIEEAHHSRKRDAPSGTALALRDRLAVHFGEDISVASTRAGHIPGTHRVGFDSAADTVTLTHAARSREGFAAGALVAARWVRGKAGVYEFSETFDEILRAAGG